LQNPTQMQMNLEGSFTRLISEADFVLTHEKKLHSVFKPAQPPMRNRTHMNHRGTKDLFTRPISEANFSLGWCICL